jgi:hypothetical protein|tara:strand:- start:1017 stop:1313 length:297 start_codon:yes stop_codon:yes gene_type:complete
MTTGKYGKPVKAGRYGSEESAEKHTRSERMKMALLESNIATQGHVITGLDRFDIDHIPPNVPLNLKSPPVFCCSPAYLRLPFWRQVASGCLPLSPFVS